MTQENISATGENLNNEMQERRNKLNALREQGQAYPNDFRRDAVSSDIIKALGDKSAEELAADPKTFTVAGRMMTRRIMGKASFATLQDMGGKIQIYVTRDALPEGQYQELFNRLLRKLTLI